MKIKLNHFWNWIKRHKVWSVLIVVIVLGIVFWALKSGSTNTQINSVKVERGGIKEEVSVTGNVKPLSDVDLAFERGGRVASLNVAVGDKVYAGQVLASVSNADLVANLDQAKANLKKASAQYGDVKVGTRAEELALQKTRVDKSTLDLSQAKVALTSSIKDSYTKADDALRNKIYSLFTDPARYNSKLSFPTDNFLREDIEKSKDNLTDGLNTWYQSLAKLNDQSDLEVYYLEAKNYLVLIKSLLDKCAEAVNDLTTESAYTSQAQIDTWKLNVSSARTSIDLAIGTLTASYNTYQAAVSALKISQNELTIKQAGSTDGQLLSAEASLEVAQAQVASAQAELNKSIISSPISGVVTAIPIKLGEIVPMNQKAISVISYGDYEVETFVPEADIAKVKIDDKAKTTLDAYGSDVVFETSAIKIDPAATMIDGVPTYKVTLKFTNQDDRIRSGMTVNLDILTNQRADVLVVPSRAVKAQTDGKYVTVVDLSNQKTSERKVVTGLRGSDGMTEILSGLEAGESVAVNTIK
jgi:RND family efflux transporter MFP subunit